MKAKLAHRQSAVKIKKQKTKIIPRKRLCARAMWTFFFSNLSKTGILLFFVLAIIFLSIAVGVPIGALLGVVFLAFYVIFLYLFAVLEHHNYYYEVSESAFQKEHGVIHKTNVTIPFNRIQNVNITRSLSDRMLGLARIDVESAGSSGPNDRIVAGGSQSSAEGHLPGVTMNQAQEIHDLLIERFANYQNQPDSHDSSI